MAPEDSAQPNSSCRKCNFSGQVCNRKIKLVLVGERSRERGEWGGGGGGIGYDEICVVCVVEVTASQ